MDNTDNNLDFLPEDEGLSVDDILAEFKARGRLEAPPPEPPEDAFYEDAPISEADPLSASPAERAFDRDLALDFEIPDELFEAQEINERTDKAYAASGNYAARSADYSGIDEQTVSLRDRFLEPLARLLAGSAEKRAARRREASLRLLDEEENRPPELKPGKAAAFYAAQAGAQRLRGVLACLVALPLLWLSLGLPAAGSLGASPVIKALVCLVLELVIVIIGLDVFTAGILTLFRRRPGADTLVAVSCLVSAVDAAVIAYTGDIKVGLPFCAASALCMICAIWGNFFSCRALECSCASAGAVSEPSVVISLPGLDGQGAILAKLKRPPTGFVREAEGADLLERAYRFAAPILLIAALVLSLFVFVTSEACDSFSHTLAATLCVCAGFTSALGFSFPFYVLSKRLKSSGVALAGYSGAAGIGRARRVQVMDTDVFPARTMSIADVSIAAHESADTVISYTGSVIAAAAMGISPLFVSLMRKNGCTLQRVEDFACHEGGGLVARINGALVYVGSSGFMQLMGIRLPKGTAQKTAVYTAINDALAGVFSINYKPVTSVQHALVTLMRARMEPIFAVRDFLITPLLVSSKFRLPMKDYIFPTFAERYRLSSQQETEAAGVVAVFARGGLNSIAGVAARGRKLYNRTRILLAVSLAGALAGAVLVLSLCRSGSYDAASCGNLIAYMLLFLLPTFIVSWDLRN
ncbi:MAG: hypothetical protein LBM18_00140 [Oscillospiraceae bacterium]|jgi:hypothetical protein|nr:hypothetical protein [Oscillospiraceae bacterium]